MVSASAGYKQLDEEFAGVKTASHVKRTVQLEAMLKTAMRELYTVFTQKYEKSVII